MGKCSSLVNHEKSAEIDYSSLIKTVTLVNLNVRKRLYSPIFGNIEILYEARKKAVGSLENIENT